MGGQNSNLRRFHGNANTDNQPLTTSTTTFNQRNISLPPHMIAFADDAHFVMPYIPGNTGFMHVHVVCMHVVCMHVVCMR